jgi:hypothetical protein
LTSSKGYLRPSCARPLGGPRISSATWYRLVSAACCLSTCLAPAWHLPGTYLALARHLLRGTTSSLPSGLACVPQLPALVLVRLLGAPPTGGTHSASQTLLLLLTASPLLPLPPAPRPVARSEIRGGPRGGDIGHRSPPGSSEELGWAWAGCGPGDQTWPLGRWVRWPETPTGTGAGSSVPPPYRTGGSRPGAESARVLGSYAVAAALSTCPGTGCNSPSIGKAFSDRQRLLSHAHFHSLARSCADSDWRSSANQGRGSLFRHPGTTDVLPSRYVTSVDHTGLLRRPPRCSVITQRAHAACSNGRPQRLPSFLHVRPRACGSSAGQSRRKNGLPHPGREPRGCLHAGGEKRGHLSAPCRQTKWGGCREGPLASDIGSFSHGGGASRADAWSTRLHCIRQQARCAT